jgi:hypothetical protein
MGTAVVVTNLCGASAYTLAKAGGENSITALS